MSTGFHCQAPRCGHPMPADFAFAAEARVAADAAVVRARFPNAVVSELRTLHVCPRCRAFHHLADDRRGFRPLTPAERFVYEVKFGAALRAHERAPAGVVPPVTILTAPKEIG